MRSNQNARGQSTVEFAMTLSLLVAVILFFLQVSLVMAFGSYVQYATFMAARSYLSGEVDAAQQRQKAVDVVVQMLKKGPGQEGVDRWPGLGRGVSDSNPAGALIGPGPQFSSSRDPTLSWQDGVRYTFRSRLLMMPLLKGQDSLAGDSMQTIDLTSESWLGREPTQSECLGGIAAASGGRGIVDNGC